MFSVLSFVELSRTFVELSRTFVELSRSFHIFLLSLKERILRRFHR